MADDELTVVRADGSTKTLRSRDVGSQVQAQKIDVGPWLPTLVASAQYSLDVTTSGVTTLTLPATATHCFISVEGGDVRYTEDGSTPVTGADNAGSGMRLEAGFFGELPCPQALKFISVTANAWLNVSYRKYV